MDLLDRLVGHDAWTTRQLLLFCQNLTDEQLDREFEIGHRTVRATLLHIIWNMEVWTDLMSGLAVRTSQGRSVSLMIERLDRVSAELARLARAVAKRGGWDERFVDSLDSPAAEKTYGGGIAHVITHSMHHRAQLLYLLRRLGVEGLPEGDVLSWEQQTVQS
jgi:uncharacterized damage-inducible protein DinB